MTAVCQAPNCNAEIEAVLCQQHARALEKSLAELPYWLQELTTTTARLDRLAGTGRAQYATRHVWSPDDDPAYRPALTLVANPMLFAWDAANLQWTARATLTWWMRHLAAAWHCCPTVTDPAVWLTFNISGLVIDQAAGDAYDELTWLSTAVQRAVDSREPEQFVGICDTSEVTFTETDGTLYADTVQCGTRLYARDGAETATCRVCGRDYDDLPDRRARLASLADNVLAPADVIADGLTSFDLPVSASTIRKWASRAAERRKHGRMPLANEIHQVGVDDDGRPLYRVGDVRARVEAGREAARARRGEQAA